MAPGGPQGAGHGHVVGGRHAGPPELLSLVMPGNLVGVVGRGRSVM